MHETLEHILGNLLKEKAALDVAHANTRHNFAGNGDSHKSSRNQHKPSSESIPS